MDKYFAPGRKYIVTGATDNSSKFGFRIAKWYLDRHLPVTLVNPREVPVLGQPTVATIQTALKKLQDEAPATTTTARTTPVQISINFVTNPAISEEILASALKAVAESEGQLSIKSVWFQPGTYDNVVLKKARSQIESVIADGDCVLVQGDGVLNSIKTKI